MPTRWLDDGHALACDVVAKVGGGGDAIAEVIFFQCFLHADGDRFEIASGETSISGISLGEDEQIFFLLGEQVVVGAEEPADVGHAIFLGGHGASVAIAEHLLRDLLWSLVFVSLLTELDEPSVLGEAAGIEIERDAVALADGTDFAHVLHGDRLASARVVGNRKHDERDALSADALDQSLEGGNIHVAFEGMLGGGMLPFFDDEIDGFRADEFDVGTCGIEMRVIGDYVAFLAGDAEEDAFGGAALVRGNDMLVAEDVLDRAFEVVEAFASGVALVAFHNAGPLAGGHRSGAGVGEQINQNIISGQQEKVVIGGFKKPLALLAGGPADGLDALDTERLDDGFDRHEGGVFAKVRYLSC